MWSILNQLALYYLNLWFSWLILYPTYDRSEVWQGAYTEYFFNKLFLVINNDEESWVTGRKTDNRPSNQSNTGDK